MLGNKDTDKLDRPAFTVELHKIHGEVRLNILGIGLLAHNVHLLDSVSKQTNENNE